MKKVSWLLGVVLLYGCKKNDVPVIANNSLSELKSITISVDNVNRDFLLYVPTGFNKLDNLSTIIALHGGNGNPEGMLKLADFRSIADRDKVLIAYPAGIENSWNDARPTAANKKSINDVNFIQQISNYLTTNYKASAKRIYVTGISNGGFMSSRLACELSNTIAAFAAVAATIEQNTVYANCNPSKPVPAMYIHGTYDPLVAILGGEMTAGSGGFIVSHAQAISKWTSINRCSNTPMTTDLADVANDGTTIKERKYTGGTNGAEVVSYVIQNGGHTWPQGLQYQLESIIGKTSQDMNACEVIWQFFKRFNR
jgi:polyhydroxybutyrate depolymerase